MYYRKILPAILLFLFSFFAHFVNAQNHEEHLVKGKIVSVQNEKEGGRNLQSFERIATGQGGSLMKKKGG